MKRFYFLSVFTMVAGLIGLFGIDAAAELKVVNSGNAKAVAGNGGNATGKGVHGGNGGSATAKAGSITTGKSGAIINSGNADAKGGNGGSAKGTGTKAGNGGDASAKAGDIGNLPPIIPGKGNAKGGPKAGPGTGGAAKAGDATATGGNGGNANGKGAKGGNGGDAIAVSGNNNTVINGSNNTVIGKVVNNNISINVGGGGGFGGGGGGGGGFGGGFVTGGAAVAQGGFGGDGAIQGAPGGAIASSPSETVITNDGTPAIAQGANGKSNVENGEVESIFTSRFVKVKNDSGVPMKVLLQYRGMDDKKWAWLPADPNDSKDALVYDLAPGQEMFLQHKGSKVAASRVRIWGVAEAQSWFDYRDQDLWVVPEMDQRGEHRYQATEMRTFTFVFPKQGNAESK